MVDQDKKDYIAFISYKRDDEETAKWLQEEIESFKLPIELLNKDSADGDFKKRYVFRDKTDMSSGVLPEVIKEGLNSSKFLIVICSTNVVKSEWVNKEIEYFISLHPNNIKKIIPFIINGEPYSKVNNCLPDAIYNIPKNKELLAININDVTGEDALQIAAVKVVSYLLGVKFNSIWDRHKRREEKERKEKLEADREYKRVESKWLCKKALDDLDKKDYHNAYLNILKALPINILDENDRPYLWEAENVLRRIYDSNINFPNEYGKPEPSYQWVSSHNGKYIATSDGISEKICIWDKSSRTLINELFGLPGELSSFQFNRNDTLLLISSNELNVIYLLPLDIKCNSIQINTIAPIYAAWSFDESIILSLSREMNGEEVISLWDASTGKCIDSKCISATGKMSRMPILSKGNRYIVCHYVREEEKEVFQGPLEGYDYYKVKYSDILIYDRLMCQEEWYRNLPEHIWNFIQISDDENYKLVSIGKGAIGLAGIHESKFSSLGVISGRLISMHFSSDGKYVKCISEKGEETIFNLLTKEQESAHLLEQIIFSSESIPSEISKDEAIEYFWSELNGVYKLKRINCSIDEDFHMNDPVEVRLSTQGRVCAIFAFPDEIALWDTYKENSYKKLQGHEGRVRFVDFSRDGKQLVSIGSDCKVNIWDAEQGKCLESIHEFDDRYSMSNTDYPLLFARFSEDGKCVLIVRNIDGIAIGYYVWDIEKRKYIYHNYKRGNIFNTNIYFGINNQVFCEELPIHIDPIFDTYCISPNNQLFAISIDNQLIIYNIADRKKLSIKKCNSRDIKYLSFSSDSRFVVSTGNSCISVWDIYEDGPVRVIEDKSMDFKEANLCTINNILYVRSNEYIHIWQHKPIQQMIDYLRGIFDV